MDEPLFQETRMSEPELPWECNGARLTHRRALPSIFFRVARAFKARQAETGIVGFFVAIRSKCPGVMSTNRRRTMRLRAIGLAESFLAHCEIGKLRSSVAVFKLKKRKSVLKEELHGRQTKHTGYLGR
jgi:hypothetical protein